MMNVDEDAVICDFAETYNIYDMESLPLLKVATLAFGLRDDSRIKLKLSGARHPIDRYMLAGCMDRLSLLVWAKSKDATKGKNRPKSMVESLNSEKKQKKRVSSFRTGEEFERMKAKIINS